jgi:hypothetical protein
MVVAKKISHFPGNGSRSIAKNDSDMMIASWIRTWRYNLAYDNMDVEDARLALVELESIIEDTLGEKNSQDREQGRQEQR